MLTCEESEEIEDQLSQLRAWSQLSMEMYGMLLYHVHFPVIWLKQNTLWQFLLDNY